MQAKSEKSLKSAEMTTSMYVYDKITVTYLVQRNSEKIEKTNKIYGN